MTNAATATTTISTKFQPLTFTISQCCTLGNFSRAWLYLQWKSGTGPRRFKAGRKTLIMANDFHSWLDALAGN